MMIGLSLLAITTGMAATQVEMNGRPLMLSEPPMLMNGRTMVPMRGIFEPLGAEVNWNESTRRINATRGDTDMQLGIGDDQAIVNGRYIYLDAPPTIVRGTTMVPLRFVGESLGADVKWLDAAGTVSISTRDVQTETTSRNTRGVIIPEGTVIPVRLDRALSSETNRQGDRVSVTVRSTYDGDAEFPRGTKIIGVVSEAQRADSSQPGMLNLAFRTIVLPNGRRIHTDGSLVSLDEKMVKQTSDGRLVVTNKDNKNRLKFIGIGAAGGLVLGKLTKHTVEGTLLGAAAGYLYSEYDKKKIQPGDVSVAAGTEFGVQLNSQLAYNPSRASVLARENFLSVRSPSARPYLQRIRVTAGGQDIIFANAQPLDENGIVLVPLAPVMDQVEIAYKYNERLQAISLDTDQGALHMNIGKSYALLNGEREELEAPARMIDGVVYVPLHFLALATGTRVVWVVDTRTVTMSSRG